MEFLPGNWAGPRVVLSGMLRRQRDLAKGRLGLQVPHEPGEYCLVAFIFLHIPLFYLRR